MRTPSPDARVPVTSRRAAVALVAALLLSTTQVMAAKGGVKGAPPKADESAGSKGQKPATSNAASDPGASAKDKKASSGRSFGSDEEKDLRKWFADSGNLEGLPPGLAKRESLPPGLRKQIEKNGTLPPGLEGKLHPLPEELERNLPLLPDGISRVVVDRDVLLVEDATSRIKDIMRDVLPALMGGK
jgi:hypothetical protein